MILIQFEWIRMNLSIIWRLWLNFTGSDYQYPSSGPWKVTVQQWVTEKCCHRTWYISKKMEMCRIAIAMQHPQYNPWKTRRAPNNAPFDPFNGLLYVPFKTSQKTRGEKPMILSTPKLVICKNFSPPPKKKKQRDIHRKKTCCLKLQPFPTSPYVGRTVVDPPRGIVGEISVAQQFPPGPPSRKWETPP